MLTSDAGISSCKRFRWWLYRDIIPTIQKDYGLIVWVMMNPSTADHSKNDPTINRIMAYSRGWGYSGLLVLNIYAIRSTQQANIKGQVGSRNDWWLSTIFEFARKKDVPIVCAWGVKHKDRGDEVRSIAKRVGKKLLCLELSTNAEPKHPLYLSKTLRPRPLKPKVK